MKSLFATFILLVSAVSASPARVEAADTAVPEAVALWQSDPTRPIPADGVRLEDFHWIARPVVVFADSPADPAYARQVELLAARAGELALRDVVIITDTNPAARTELRRELRPRGFMLTLISKEGVVQLRKPFPWDVRELTRSIDKMPIRQQEIRERAGR